MTADPPDGRSHRPESAVKRATEALTEPVSVAGAQRRVAEDRDRRPARSGASPEDAAAGDGHGADPPGAARAHGRATGRCICANLGAEPRRRRRSRRPSTSSLRGSREGAQPRRAGRCRRPLSISPGSAPASTRLTVHVDALARCRASRASSPRPFRCESPVSKTDSHRPRVCSAPTACAARPASYPLDPPTVRRLGAALVRALPHGDGVAAAADRPRHARVGRLDRGRARARRVGRGRDGDERRRRADAGRRLPDADGGLRRRRRDLRVAQSVRGQRHQGVLGPRREVHRARRARGRGDRRRPVVAGARTATPAPRAAAPISSAPISITCARCSRSADARAAFRLAIDCANGATTTVAPALFASLGLRDRRHRQPARRPQHQPGLRVDASRAAGADGRRAAAARWASRSTATAIARSSSIIAGGSSTATPCC